VRVCSLLGCRSLQCGGVTWCKLMILVAEQSMESRSCLGVYVQWVLEGRCVGTRGGGRGTFGASRAGNGVGSDPLYRFPGCCSTPIDVMLVVSFSLALSPLFCYAFPANQVSLIEYELDSRTSHDTKCGFLQKSGVFLPFLALHPQ
jgi:hypothetical protein